MPDRTEHRDESVRLLDLITVDADMTAWIDGHNFFDCELVGPVVLLFGGDNIAFNSNRMDRAQLWTIEPDRGYLGAVRMRNCVFHGCTFRDVGIAAPREVIDQFGA